MVPPVEDGNETGRLVEDFLEPLRLAGKIEVPRLHRLGAADQTGLVTQLAQAMQFGHVDGVLEDEFHLAVAAELRGMRGAPVARFHHAVRPRDVVADMGNFIEVAGCQHPVQRRAQQLVAVGGFLAREGVEQIAADQIGPLPHRRAQVGIVHPGDRQIAVHHDVGIR